MKFIVAGPAGRRDVDVRLDPVTTSVAELARAVGLAAPPGAEGPSSRDGTPGAGPSPAQILVDGLAVPGDLSVTEAGVHEGALLGEAEDTSGSFAGAVEVCVVAGLHAGRRVPLGVGSHVLGRSPDCDVVFEEPTVSRRHCRIDVAPDASTTLTPLAGENPTYVDGRARSEPVRLAATSVVEIGSLAVAVRPPVSGDEPAGTDRFRDVTAAGTINLNRPPRFALPPEPAPLDVPRPPDKARQPPFSIAALLAPIAMGGVMVVAFHSAMYALFTLMSPMMLLGNWWESKQRAGRSLRRDTRRFDEDLGRFDAALDAAVAAEAARRRALLPDLAEVLRRADAPSVQLWQRRIGHLDMLQLSAGIGDTTWTVPRTRTGGDQPPQAVLDRLERAGQLRAAAIPVDLAEGGVVGIVGDRQAALALARALLCQAAVHHGPADLRIAVATEDSTGGEWDWAKWLPHTRDTRPGPAERRLLAAGAAHATRLFDDLLAGRLPGNPPPAPAGGPVTLYVIDGDGLLAGRNSPGRALLRGDGGPAAGIVVAGSADRLPAVCTTVLTVDELGAATRSEPRRGGDPLRLLATGVDVGAARACAVHLARFEDPELHIAGAGLPELAPLPGLLELDDLEPTSVAARWGRSSGGHLRAPIGAGEGGPFVLDFDRHGPHGLIGGTTGSGKSELLKTIVAAFAASYPPEELTFGLFDFKGGSTFTEFAGLPHTVGMASDLDVSLARRALQCLRAELVQRERLFDRAGAKDLGDYRSRQGTGAGPDLPPVPRLVVIIDEFAAMATELAEEIGALTDLTARGRSLGVHLLLATQKPSTAVNAEIRANTRLRISLQVEDKQDSLDVVGIPDAAAIRHKGRGLFRVGQTDVVAIQTALASGTSTGRDGPLITVAPFVFGADPRGEEPPSGPTVDGGAPAGAEAAPNDLVRLVKAATDAFAASSRPPPRRPWPDPLPDSLHLADLEAVADSPAPPGADLVSFVLVDDPDAQTRYPSGWSLERGNMLVFGVVGSGATTALVSIAASFAQSRTADQGHIYGLDFGSGALGAVARLPHTGTVVGATDRERQLRLVRELRAEMDRRRNLPAAARPGLPSILLLIDNVEAFRSEYETAYGIDIVEQTVRLYTEGPDVGIHTAATASRLGGVPSALSAATPQKLILQLADPNEYGSFAIRRQQLPTFVPGRGILAETGRAVQVAVPGADIDAALAEVASRTPPPTAAPLAVALLPDAVNLEDLGAKGRVGTDEWRLPIGMAEADLSPLDLVLYEMEHATVAGPSRSGRSTTLLALAAALRAAAPSATILGVALRRSPLRSSPLVSKVAATAADIASVADAALMASGPTLLLIDDAEGVDDQGGRLAQLLAAGRSELHIAIGGRADVLRTQYGHWTQTVRRSKAGVLLQPNLDYDGELLGARLPNRLHISMPPGRGFVVADGRVGLGQMARPG
ncbi:FHA domain-containing protein [Acidiferrimicrobium sp. IK]|uniref:FtsK/SpoIIIE domain-containing protein n=1 Tax=Acidiferrimicrobium sp. IK TaxID=2871700 RepID=UPI0021CB470C|nr:FtsK/SpoIIIE domain-containing protein [Acidiferrimicrobium sp. IK]MCU4184691.1 FHA domain-containing protein [Acidiferrimicrobium sp. IK]